MNPNGPITLDEVDGWGIGAVSEARLASDQHTADLGIYITGYCRAKPDRRLELQAGCPDGAKSVWQRQRLLPPLVVVTPAEIQQLVDNLGFMGFVARPLGAAARTG